MARFCHYRDENDNLVIQMPHTFKPDYHVKEALKAMELVDNQEFEKEIYLFWIGFNMTWRNMPLLEELWKEAKMKFYF
jgi:hypothetical protein